MEETRVSVAIRARITAAAQAVWRVSEPDWFDPSLREEMRRNAASVIGTVGALSVGALSPAQHGIDAVLAAAAATEELIRFARDRSLVSDENAERMLQSYRAIRENVSALRTSTSVPGAEEPALRSAEVSESATELHPLSGRQQRIITFVRENGQARVSDLTKIFDEEVSEKTLQRDLLYLVSSGILRRRGDTRWTIYFYSQDYRQGDIPKTV